MNLEEIELKCFNYLKQVTNPLVPIEQLLDHLHREPEFASISLSELTSFLERHELFKVVEPIGVASNLQATKELEEAGITFGPRVILSTRVPSASQLAQQMKEEMGRLGDALQGALADAQKAGDAERARTLIKILARAQALQERLEELT